MSLKHDLIKIIDDRNYTGATNRTYRSSIKGFCEYARDNNINSKSLNKLNKDEIIKVLQNYEVYCEDKYTSASTIHTKLASVCSLLNINLKEIQKPIRSAANITRSRNKEKNIRGQKEMQMERFKRIVDFQSGVGIRRNELKNLYGRNLIKKDNEIFVEVEKGKGGRFHIQSILPMYYDIVLKTFKKVHCKMK